MDETRWERWGAASGFGAILMGAAAMAFERGSLSASDPAAKIAAHFADNGDALRAQALLFVLGSGSFIWFAGSLRSYLCLLYTSPSPRDLSTSRMPSSA